MEKPIIPIFFACDDAFVKFTIVAITSLKDNASKDYKYDIHILYTNISKDMKAKALELADDTFSITFDDVSRNLKVVNYKLHVRDYYSKTTYYRLFIPDICPQYDKAIYIDSDTIILGDISEFFNHDIGDNYVGACNEQAMYQTEVYGNYVEKCLGISRKEYFNAGVLLINCAQWRTRKVLDQFIKLLHEYTFTVTQDEDYLNLICKGNVCWLENSWDMEVYGEIKYKPEEFNIIHYIMVAKPWHYHDCQFKEFFWKYAEQTSVYEEIKQILDSYTDEQRKADYDSCDRLAALAESEANRPDNYLARQTRLALLKKNIKKLISRPEKPLSKERLDILDKIDLYEKEGRFFDDVEDDPPTRPIEPGEVDYLNKKLSSKIMTKYAFACARKYVRKLLRSKQMIMDGIVGIENMKNLNSGAIITCNHFNALDSFAIHLTYDASEQKHRRFYRIIREGNYTSYPGFYGLLMKHCYTLPLASSHKVMNEFMNAVNTLLQKGHFVLVYPEQGMWWNYRKPRPFKKGAFTFAAKNKVPVLPCFITMEDSDYTDNDGFPVQKYTVHVSKPIYPKEEYDRHQNEEYLMSENYLEWKRIYEMTYGIPLSYE